LDIKGNSEKSLGKTKIRYFNTNYNNSKSLKVFNNISGLSNSLNFYFFEFPFLDGVTNDPTRHVWFDTFVKYAQREVSGSSVSKYTIAGVPFFKKKFDFNLKKGIQKITYQFESIPHTYIQDQKFDIMMQR
jgi:hypothetical protein